MLILNRLQFPPKLLGIFCKSAQREVQHGLPGYTYCYNSRNFSNDAIKMQNNKPISRLFLGSWQLGMASWAQPTLANMHITNKSFVFHQYSAFETQPVSDSSERAFCRSWLQSSQWCHIAHLTCAIEAINVSAKDFKIGMKRCSFFVHEPVVILAACQWSGVHASTPRLLALSLLVQDNL